ncbi:MAG: hypothetical protein J1F05_00450 [Muribaculaceae bacterium]|nr:hypothetical protein [Muribaculaceae bacterium]
MLKIYASDERLIVYDDNERIWDTFPGVVSENNRPVDFILSENELDNSSRRIVRPFKGGVISSYVDAEWLLRKAIRQSKKLRPLCRIAVNPGSGGIELRAMQDWYHKWYNKQLPELVYEPIAFLKGLDLYEGVVLTQRASMIELSIVRENEIIEYKSSYFNLDCNCRDVNQENHYIEKIIKRIVNECNNLDCSLPIYFTSYKELYELSDNDFDQYQIKRIDYDNFCMNIINGLGSDSIPLVLE